MLLNAINFMSCLGIVPRYSRITGVMRIPLLPLTTDDDRIQVTIYLLNFAESELVAEKSAVCLPVIDQN